MVHRRTDHDVLGDERVGAALNRQWEGDDGAPEGGPKVGGEAAQVGGLVAEVELQ